jgi:hypothetical protein
MTTLTRACERGGLVVGVVFVSNIWVASLRLPIGQLYWNGSYALLIVGAGRIL